METQAALTQHLVNAGVLQTPTLTRIFGTVNRADFVPDAYCAEAYTDAALPIGHEQTISQPTVVALMLELLQPAPGDRVLDIGSGSGWTTTLLAEAVAPDGYVWGIERIPELAATGARNMRAYNIAHAEIQTAGETLGLPEYAPFDKILVSAAAETVPDTLLTQLADGGTLVLPVENAIWQIQKQEGRSLRIEKHGGFAFVPLIQT